MTNKNYSLVSTAQKTKFKKWKETVIAKFKDLSWIFRTKNKFLTARS